MKRKKSTWTTGFLFGKPFNENRKEGKMGTCDGCGKDTSHRTGLCPTCRWKEPDE